MLKCYFKGSRSSRNLSTFGSVFIILTLIMFCLLIILSDHMPTWLLLIPSCLLIILSYLLFKTIKLIINNPTVIFIIHEEGILYGNSNIKWSQIKRIYPRG